MLVPSLLVYRPGVTLNLRGDRTLSRHLTRRTSMVNVTQIKQHMDVIASDGQKIGRVDHVEGQDKIKLTKSDSADGKHHLVPVNWVDHIDQHVHLNKAAQDVKKNWSEAA
jgi:hypothetical protein